MRYFREKPEANLTTLYTDPRFQTVIVYNFSEIKNTVLVPFLDYVTGH